MDEDRYDRFVSEMTVHKTLEEAFAAHDATAKRREEQREARRIMRESENTVFGGPTTCVKCGNKTPMHPGYSGCTSEGCPHYHKEFRDSIKDVP